MEIKGLKVKALDVESGKYVEKGWRIKIINNYAYGVINEDSNLFKLLQLVVEDVL